MHAEVATPHPSDEEPTPVGPPMTMDEITAAYPDRYLILGDLERDEHGTLIRGVVLCHGATRKEAFALLDGVRPHRYSIATHFTGRVPRWDYIPRFR